MIRITRKRLIVTTVVLLLLAGSLVVTWEACDWPPPRLILKYGLPPAGGPTGRRMTVEGIEFIELAPGYFRMGSHWGCGRGDWLGRLCAPLGIPFGRHPRHRANPNHECPPRWVEVQGPVWISRDEVTAGQFARSPIRTDHFVNDHQRSRPASRMTWNEAQEFAAWLGRDRPGVFRLPSEHEWEYACRAGTSTLFWWGDEPMEGLDHPRENPWGFRDMIGSLREWCGNAWSELPSVALAAPDHEVDRVVIRGASNAAFPFGRRCTNRVEWRVSLETKSLGFRVAFVAGPP